MPTGFLDLLRQSRRPLIAVAIVLVVVQTLVAGLATAQSAALLASGPFDASAICHGMGGGDTSSDPAPNSSKAVCCVFCAATAPALLPVMPPVAGRFEHAGNDNLPAADPDRVMVARRAVRAGPSQAPPSLG